jgi:hypothetical protein
MQYGKKYQQKSLIGVLISPSAPDLFKRSFFNLDFPACRLSAGRQGKQVGSFCIEKKEYQLSFNNSKTIVFYHL